MLLRLHPDSVDSLDRITLDQNARNVLKSLPPISVSLSTDPRYFRPLALRACYSLPREDSGWIVPRRSVFVGWRS